MGKRQQERQRMPTISLSVVYGLRPGEAAQKAGWGDSNTYTEGLQQDLSVTATVAHQQQS